MKFFEDVDERAYRKARKRLQQVSVQQVQAWANTSLWAVQEALDANDPAALPQARLGIVGVLAAVDTLLDTVE